MLETYFKIKKKWLSLCLHCSNIYINICLRIYKGSKPGWTLKNSIELCVGSRTVAGIFEGSK